MDKPRYTNALEASRIYFLPNLMTAGNLFCGFSAMIACIEARFTARTNIVEQVGNAIAHTPEQLYERAIFFILLAVVFDSLDGRLARLGGQESLFGKEFDSIADIVSFGVAPAMLVFFMILSPTVDMPAYRQMGFFIGFVYLVCAAIRLARFNVITSPLLDPDESLPKDDFLGLPVPAAAGTIASIVLILNQLPDRDIPFLTLFLPFFLLIVALLMVSKVHYPSFKHINWKTTIKLRTLILLSAFIYIAVKFHFFALGALFVSYLTFGILRHIARSIRRRKLDAAPKA